MFYAVKVGRKPGIYATWGECEAQVKNYAKPVFRKFQTQQEAEEFLSGASSSQGSQNGSKPTTQSLRTKMSRDITPVTPRAYSSIARSRSDPSLTPDKSPSASLTPVAMEALIEMKASVKQLQQQVGMITQTLAYLSNGLSTLETSLNTSVSPSVTPVKSFSSRQPTSSSTLKRHFSDDCDTMDESSVKKALTEAWVDNNFSGDLFNDTEAVEVYTDGACFNNGKSGAVAGIGVYWGDRNSDNLSERLTGRPTNNRAEIHAAVRAIEQAKSKRIKNLIIYTDSEFLINSITKWINGWKRKGWVLSTGKPVVNKDDFLELDDALKGINVKWVHVRGHRGIPGNEAADRLANEGARKPLP